MHSNYISKASETWIVFVAADDGPNQSVYNAPWAIQNQCLRAF